MTFTLPSNYFFRYKNIWLKTRQTSFRPSLGSVRTTENPVTRKIITTTEKIETESTTAKNRFLNNFRWRQTNHKTKKIVNDTKDEIKTEGK